MPDPSYSLRQYGVCLEASERDTLVGLRDPGASIAALYTAPLNTARLDADWREYVARLDAATSYQDLGHD